MKFNISSFSCGFMILVFFLCFQVLDAQQDAIESKSRNFVVASSNNFPPMNVLDKNGNLTGFGRDISSAAIKAIGGKVSYIHSPHWVQVLEWLDSGRADFIHDTGYTEDRDGFLDYTTPIIEMPEVIFVRSEQYDITDFNSLKGKSVACVNKHITHLYLKQFPEINCYVVKTPVQGLYELVAGKVDAFVYPKQIVLYLIQNLRLGDKIKITGDNIRTLTWSMVVKEGNKEVLDLLNKGIAIIRKNGEYERIYDKWWGKKILAGYSKRELHVITSVITGMSIVLVLLILLVFFNRRLYKSKRILNAEIAERKQAEEALQESERKYKDLQDSSIDGYAWTDMEGHLIEVNDSYKNMMGYSEDELRKLTYKDITPEKWHSSEQKILTEQILARGYSDPYEKEFIRKDGTIFPVELRAYLIKDDQSNTKGMRAVVIDITERKQLEEEKQKIHKLESIGILAGGIAHDFNNLLAGILNNIYLSKMHIDRESKAHDSLESAEKAISRATNLTGQLLTFARGGAPIKKTASIIEIIKESAEFVLRGSNVKCEYIVADDLWPVEVDEGQMNQVIHNLILNANQSMPEGGTIRITTENSNLGPDIGLPIKEGRYVKVAVQDQGIGISEEHLKYIFDPYFTTKEAERGLGLSITYSIIKQHDGLLTADSELGVGTIFIIYLPASEKRVKEKESVECTAIAGGGKILIMDDEEIIRESVGEFLTMKGYEVEYAEDGDETIELYKKAFDASQPFDAVILDLTIRGGMGGKATVKKLLEIDPDVKAIVSSGYSNDPVMANHKKYGFSDVFCKASNSPDDLCRILNNVLKIHQ